MRARIWVDPARDVITHAQFEPFGCGSNLESYRALPELVVGKTPAGALLVSHLDIARALGDLPEQRMYCSVLVHEALRAAVADQRGQAANDDANDPVTCRCFAVRESMIGRAVRMNRLTSVPQVTHYTNAALSCGTCADRVRAVLSRLNAEMLAEGLLTTSETLRANQERSAPSPTWQNAACLAGSISVHPTMMPGSSWSAE